MELQEATTAGSEQNSRTASKELGMKRCGTCAHLTNLEIAPPPRTYSFAESSSKPSEAAAANGYDAQQQADQAKKSTGQAFANLRHKAKLKQVRVKFPTIMMRELLEFVTDFIRHWRGSSSLRMSVRST